MARKLTDTQRVILSHAAKREDHQVLPVPPALNKNAGAIAQALKPLIANGLIRDVLGPGEKKPGDSEANASLIITEEGLVAIGVEITDEHQRLASGGAVKTAPQPTELSGTNSPRAGTKLAALVDMLTAPSGATVTELSSATGWQAHSVRGAISGGVKKKLGLEVTSELIDGRGRVYRAPPLNPGALEIAQDADAAADARPEGAGTPNNGSGSPLLAVQPS